MKTNQAPSPTLRRLIIAQSCVLMIASSPSWAQMTQTPASDAATLAKYDKNKDGILDASERAAMDAATASASAAAPAPEEDTIMLSPFEVNSEATGYYAANSMSGTRFNTKLEDLASSLTVVTKEQMEDFAMLDINDVFLYTASTEGSGTYTAFTVDRNGSVSDGVQSNPTQANRVRGVAPANVSYGNIETMGRAPIDPSTIDSIEVSRGPNANVFGLGNPSGTVNQVAAGANVTRDRSQVSMRIDSYGGYRASVDFNRVLIKDKLAVRFGGVTQTEEFIRKPSGVDTARLNGMIRYKPFKSTTISASYLYYRANGNRPNFLPPRDSVSFWVASGKPSWDPAAQLIHLGGVTYGANAANTALEAGSVRPITVTTYLPSYFTNTFTGSTRTFAYVDQTGLTMLSMPQSTLNTTPVTNSGTIRLMSPTPAAGTALGKFTGQPLFTTTPTVQDKSIYDWSEVNISAVNRAMDRIQTTNFQIDQFFINNQKQTFAVQFGLMREDAERNTRNHIGIANDNGQSGQLLVDVNEKQLDGTTNPYFMRPYIGVDQPRSTREPATWDTYRGQFAYRLDLTQERGAIKWLGAHTITGYNEYKYRINRRYSFRDVIADNHAWIAPWTPRGNQGGVTGGPGAAPAVTREYFRYYVGDATGTNVDYAPTSINYGVTSFLYGNPTNGFVRENVDIQEGAVTDSTGAGSNSKTILKTRGAVMQSHFLNDALVTTFGLRDDKQYVKFGSTPQLLNMDGTTFYYDSINHWALGDWKFNSGKTKTGGAVLRPFRGMEFANSMANSPSAVTSFFGNVVRGLSLTYNKADSFLPADPKINLYFQSLPNPEGHGKDYGFGLNMYDGKVVVRVNRYDTQQVAARGGDASTIAQRVTRIDLASTANFLLQTQALAWVTTDPSHVGWTTAQIQAEVGRQMGMPWDTQTAVIAAFNAGTLASTNDIAAKGTEIEVNVNPTKFWTVSANVTEGRSITSNISNEIAQWISERMPIWTTIKDPRGPDHLWSTPDDAPVSWWTTRYGTATQQNASENYQSFVGTTFNVVKQLDGKANPQIRRYNARLSTSYKLAGVTENATLKKFTVGGAIRWEDKGAIGYYGHQDSAGVYIDLDASRPVYDKAHYYFDAFVTYRTRLWGDRVNTSIQLNVRNLTEGGRLQPISVYPDGTPNTYRIVDPRQFILQATFDL